MEFWNDRKTFKAKKRQKVDGKVNSWAQEFVFSWGYPVLVRGGWQREVEDWKNSLMCYWPGKEVLGAFAFFAKRRVLQVYRNKKSKILRSSLWVRARVTKNIEEATKAWDRQVTPMIV